MNRYQQSRFERLMPNGTPRYIRIYDNGGKTFDRYTVVFTHNFPNRNRKCLVRAMSKNPKSPQGFQYVGEYNEIIDFPSYSHLGKKNNF
jgi:hypothetical protein